MYIHANWTVQNVTFPASLKEITGSCVCDGGNMTQLVRAITASSLTSVGTSPNSAGIVVSNYANISSLSFPKLATVGSNLVISNNPSLNTINGFGSLNAVTGNVDITGDFESFELPSLAFVNGSFNVQSTKNITCPDLLNMNIKGSATCQGNVANPQPLMEDSVTPQEGNFPNVTAAPTLVPVSSTRTASATATTTSATVATTSATSMSSILKVSGILYL